MQTLDKSIENVRERLKNRQTLPDSSSAGDYEVSQRRYKIDRLLADANLPERHKDRKLGELKQNSEWAKSFSTLSGVVEAGAIAILLGKRGNGKTQAAVEALKRTCEELRAARYIHARMLYNEILDKADNGRRTEAVNYFTKPHLLVIDELQDSYETISAAKDITLLIDIRYGACKPTILIANLTVEGVSKALGPSVIDRARESGGVVEFKGESFRAGVKL